jgi:hypothetical protein
MLPRRCRECGCTDENACVRERAHAGQSQTCHWIEIDLCSACAPDAQSGWKHPASYTVGRYGSTFVTGRRSWRVPPGGRPRILLGLGEHWPLFARLRLTGREIVVPWWVAVRLDPKTMDTVR